MRRPVSAKKMALISSDLPRENSATKATTSFSLPSRSRSASICSAGGAVGEVVLGEKARQRLERARRARRASRRGRRDWWRRRASSRLARGVRVMVAQGPRTSRDETLARRRRADVSHSRRCRVASAPPARSAPLAAGQKNVARCALDDAPDRRAAAHARLAGAAVDPRLELELAGRAVGVAEVAQGRAAELDARAPASRAPRRRAALGARPADAVAARARVDAGLEQRLAGVDVAGADDDVAAEQRRLDRDAAPAQRGVQVGAVEARRRRARGRARRAASPPAPRRRAGDQTTAPKRRGSVRRSVPRAVTRSKWSCGAGRRRARRRTRASPTCPGASAGRRARAEPEVLAAPR